MSRTEPDPIEAMELSVECPTCRAPTGEWCRRWPAGTDPEGNDFTILNHAWRYVLGSREAKLREAAERAAAAVIPSEATP